MTRTGPTCEHCNHRHLSEAVCHNSENREHLCGCLGTKETGHINLCNERSTAMKKAHSLKNRPDHKSAAAGERATDAGENKAPARRVTASPIGMRISKCNMKESSGGGADGVATVVGIAIAQGRDLVECLGQDVQLKTADDGRKLNGTLRSIQFTASKDDKPARVSLKVSGGRQLDSLIGVGVRIEPLQKSLL
jgi:hypothetical protein